MTDMRKSEDIGKMSIVQLNEILHRQKILLNNYKLIEKLSDKGESIKKFRDKVEKEIQCRTNLQDVEASINKMSLNENEKHVQKLCELEKTPKKERYKPFATLNKIKEVPSDSKIFKIMEDCVHCNKPTKQIPLLESLDILKKQDERTREEQVRARHRRILEKLKEYEESEEGESSDESNSETLALEEDTER